MKLRLPRLPKLPRPERPIQILSTAVELAGIGCLVTAAWWWIPIAGLIALGVALVLIGWGLDR